MKKVLIILVIVLAAIIAFIIFPNKKNTKSTNIKTTIKENNYVSYNGALSVKGTKLVNKYGKEFRLHGLSAHGLQWYGNLVNDKNIKILKNEWKSNVFRLPVYTIENGYVDGGIKVEDVEKMIDMIISNDMYVIVDWHILNDKNPMKYKKEAKEFFKTISKKYKNSPNIIYELCNEPNGEEVSWNEDIKPYAEEVSAVIRKNTEKSIILVGTPNWSQYVDEVINNKINDDNTMYTFHFYTGGHGTDIRNHAIKALDNNIPVFVSEWGLSKPDGTGGVYIEEAKAWIDFMDKYNLSWINWSLSNKDETSALLKPEYETISDEALTESGQYIKSLLTK